MLFFVITLKYIQRKWNCWSRVKDFQDSKDFQSLKHFLVAALEKIHVAHIHVLQDSMNVRQMSRCVPKIISYSVPTHRIRFNIPRCMRGHNILKCKDKEFRVFYDSYIWSNFNLDVVKRCIILVNEFTHFRELCMSGVWKILHIFTFFARLEDFCNNFTPLWRTILGLNSDGIQSVWFKVKNVYLSSSGYNLCVSFI
jgi:hypothetical protein